MPAPFNILKLATLGLAISLIHPTSAHFGSDSGNELYARDHSDGLSARDLHYYNDDGLHARDLYPHNNDLHARGPTWKGSKGKKKKKGATYLYCVDCGDKVPFVSNYKGAEVEAFSEQHRGHRVKNLESAVRSR